MRRRQNNPILTGEAGVGKTAVVEGFALRLAKGDVPPPLQNVSLYTLDIGLLQAGASMKGEFENRLRQVIEDVQASPKPIILFIDEAHTLIGAGGAAGHRRRREPAEAGAGARHAAHDRRHDVGRVQEVHREGSGADPPLPGRAGAEPSEEKAILMVRGVASVLEKHHRVQVLDEALEAAVRLSHRYIPARQLPDKAVSLLDTTCARVAISQHAVPPQLEDCRRRIEGSADRARDHRPRGSGRRRMPPSAGRWPERSWRRPNGERSELEDRWQAERELVDRVLEIRATLRKPRDERQEAARSRCSSRAHAGASQLRARPDPCRVNPR